MRDYPHGIYVKMHQQRKIKKGICRDCTKPATKGIFCDYHREKYSQKSAALRSKRRHKNLCVRCGIPVDPNSKIHCTRHMLEFKRAYTKKDRKLSGGIKDILKKDRINKHELIQTIKILGELAKSPEFDFFDPIDKEIFNLRILSRSVSLRNVAKKLDISYELVRQKEMVIAEKFKNYLLNKNYITEEGNLTSNAVNYTTNS